VNIRGGATGGVHAVCAVAGGIIRLGLSGRIGTDRADQAALEIVFVTGGAAEFVNRLGLFADFVECRGVGEAERVNGLGEAVLGVVNVGGGVSGAFSKKAPSAGFVMETEMPPLEPSLAPHK